MNEKTGTAWTFLHNCLYLVSSGYSDITHLDSPVFEIFDELDSAIIGGLNERTLSFFISKCWINENEKRELEKFRDHVNKIDGRNWNPDDFDNLEDWKLARDWANALMSRLKMKKDGWNSEGKIVIYTKE